MNSFHNFPIYVSTIDVDDKTVHEVKVKLKQSHYRPGQALRVPGS